MSSAQETAARHLASKGPEKIDEFQSIVNRASEILAEEGLDALRVKSVVDVEPYSWEITKSRTSVRKIPFMAAIEDEATGEGLTAYFYAAPCRNEDELRRHLARHIGRHLANAARVTPFSKPLPSAKFFLSSTLTEKLEGVAKGNGGPGALSFFAKYHMNYA